MTLKDWIELFQAVLIVLAIPFITISIVALALYIIGK